MSRAVGNSNIGTRRTGRMTNIRAITVLVAALASAAVAQIPNIGWCPDYLAKTEFDLQRFIGTWYEQERYFAILEAGSRCVRTNYTQAIDGRILVSNEVTNRLTGIKRVLEGEIRDAATKRQDAKIKVKYTTLPYPFETTYTILDTDYDNYAVIWSCSGLGLVNTQNAWIMTRQRVPNSSMLQRAYGILDTFKINRAFFVKTDQSECQIAEPASENDVNKQGADKDKNKEDEGGKNKRNKNNEEENVRSTAGVVSEPVAVAVEKEQQQRPVEPKKPVVAVDPVVVQQDKPVPVQSDVASVTEDKQSSPVEESVVADPKPVKQSSVVDAAKKQ